MSSLHLGSKPGDLSLWLKGDQQEHRASPLGDYFQVITLLLLEPFLHGHESGATQICRHIDRFISSFGEGGSN